MIFNSIFNSFPFRYYYGNSKPNAQTQSGDSWRARAHLSRAGDVMRWLEKSYRNFRRVPLCFCESTSWISLKRSLLISFIITNSKRFEAHEDYLMAKRQYHHVQTDELCHCATVSIDTVVDQEGVQGVCLVSVRPNYFIFMGYLRKMR